MTNNEINVTATCIAALATQPNSIEKIKRVRAFLDENGRSDAEIQVDGNVSIPNALRMKEAGANIFVLGTAVQRAKGFAADDFSRFRIALDI